MDGPVELAESLGDKKVLHVAYYFGAYMPQQESEALTLAIYSADGKHGWLFDMVWADHDYWVANLPDIVKAPKHWRVGEINGGLWSYTRLWYLAQEIGARPRQQIPVKAIIRSQPASCEVGQPVWPTNPVQPTRLAR